MKFIFFVLLCGTPQGVWAKRAELVEDRQITAFQIYQVKLGLSNVFILKGEQGALLIEAGSPQEQVNIDLALLEVGLSLSQLKAVILTHGHGDHAGTARYYEDNQIPIYVGAGDRPMVLSGLNDELKPTSLFARVLKPFVDLRFAPLVSPVLVDRALDFGTQGFPQLEVWPMAGHTDGSLVVVIHRKIAIVGDMLAGGYLNGLLFRHKPGEHYFQRDRVKNQENLRYLKDAGIKKFLVGHGGPIIYP